MRSDDWHLAEDLDDFLARTGGFLRSRPALHTVTLTATEALRTRGPGADGAEAPVFGWLEKAGEVRAAFHRIPPRRLILTPFGPEDADVLAARLAGLGRPIPGVSAESDTAAAFAEAWQRHAGATATLRDRIGLYRLGTLIPPEPFPEGRVRAAGEGDSERVRLWYRDFAAAVGRGPSWADTRYADRNVTFFETLDGTAVSMAATTPVVAGQVRVDPVYTPAHLRGRGYGAAATVEASRAARAAGATEVVLFTDLANPVSNRLYQRVGYVRVTDFAAYEFSYTAQDGPA
ncbi:MAG TPA: GNAT family N-acetyltransferase [Actinocrinis sp.]|jgi:RimJ/RimL family protein N-acetyltransferase